MATRGVVGGGVEGGEDGVDGEGDGNDGEGDGDEGVGFNDGSERGGLDGTEVETFSERGTGTDEVATTGGRVR